MYAITMIVPNVSDAFEIANQFLMVVTILTIVVAIIFIILLINRITRPLYLFEDFAQNMRNNQFTPLEVHTNDELQSVSESLNSMGAQVIEYQNSLNEKNIQMEHLLDNVAHDLKTPISLVQLYAHGIKDGMDDGLFLDTIIEENEQMSSMVNQLLYLTQIERKQYEISQINVSDMILQLIEKYAILARTNEIEIQSTLEDSLLILGSEELLQSLFLNLITNAVKYSSGKQIIIHLSKQRQDVVFTITNETDNEMLDKEKMWTPYYVGEKSRNKKISGTGLGLSIVKKICEVNKFSIECLQENVNISFIVTMPGSL